MGKELPLWCMYAQSQLLMRKMTVKDLAEQVGFTRQYVSEIIHGRRRATPAEKAINDALNIPDDPKAIQKWYDDWYKSQFSN